MLPSTIWSRQLLRSAAFRRHHASQSAVVGTLKDKIQALGTKKAPQVASLRKVQGGKSLGEVTVGMCIGGMRGIKCMLSETSYLDPIEGIRYRGRTLKECNAMLPKAAKGKVGLPEAAMWLMLTDEIPSDSDVAALNEELHRRETLPAMWLMLTDEIPSESDVAAL